MQAKMLRFIRADGRTAGKAKFLTCGMSELPATQLPTRPIAG